MDFGTTLVAMSPFLMVVGIVAVVMWSQSSNKRMTQETIREMVRAGQTPDADTVKALGVKPKGESNGDLRAGMVLLALAAAIIVTGFLVSGMSDVDSDVLRGTLAGASFPGFIGLVLLGFGLANQKKKAEPAETPQTTGIEG